MARNRFATFGTVWTFKTRRFLVSLELERTHGYQYNGEDEDGETQAALDSGEFVAFDSLVTVEFDGPEGWEEIGSSSLCGSVYKADEVAEFYTAHRDIDSMNRNCSVMRKARGDNVVICHYFPDMVREAIAEARQAMLDRKAELESLPYMRAA